MLMAPPADVVKLPALAVNHTKAAVNDVFFSC
jgi:hypothetical protein